MVLGNFQIIEATFIRANSWTIREDHMEYSSMLTERYTVGNICRGADTVMDYSNGQVGLKVGDNGN